MSEGGERTEAPTQKRKNDALKKGDVLRSKEFATALVMLVGVAWMVMAGPSLVRACAQVMATSFRFGRSDVEDFSPFRPLFEAGTALLPSLLILFAVTLAAAVVSGLAMGSGAFNASLFAPKASRINPASGLKRIFGMNGWIELGKNLVKVVLLGVIGGWMLWKARASTMGLAASDLNTALGQLGDTFLGVMIAMAGGLALIAAGDLPIQIIRRLAKLRMTKQEVKDEHKESEGNPEHKAHARALARKLLSGGARKAVMEAHVVLTNPTHFAVALRYDRGKDQVPVVVAKGRGATALAIRELAGEAKVPVLEYPLLARAVYYTSREGQEIRDDLYRAIATVLAFVFGLNERARHAHGGDMPMVEVPIGARFDENGAVIR